MSQICLNGVAAEFRILGDGRLTGAVTVDRTPAMRDLRRLVAEEGHLDEVEASSR